jgi:hypothetical protein
MPIGNLTSQLFANLYLDPLDHFVKDTLRVRHFRLSRSIFAVRDVRNIGKRLLVRGLASG